MGEVYFRMDLYMFEMKDMVYFYSILVWYIFENKTWYIGVFLK